MDFFKKANGYFEPVTIVPSYNLREVIEKQ